MKREQDVQSLILGGTELSLILQNGDTPEIHIIDTTDVLVDSVLEALK